MTHQLVSGAWLVERLKDANLVLLDASTAFNAQESIKGAQHFDIKNVFSDISSPFPNTFPSVEQFEIESQKLGINSDSHIVVFDDKGIFTSPRVWWMFTVMGHKKISVLDGGLPEWKSYNFPIGNSNSEKRVMGNFKAMFNSESVKLYKDILDHTETSMCSIIDARSSGRFQAIDPEPRSHIKSGHIKNSINLPYTAVLDNRKFKSPEELKTIFKELNLVNKPVIFSCGSGITACIILFAFTLISDQQTAVYDGSWTEWAEKQGLFV